MNRSKTQSYNYMIDPLEIDSISDSSQLKEELKRCVKILSEKDIQLKQRDEQIMKIEDDGSKQKLRIKQLEEEVAQLKKARASSKKADSKHDDNDTEEENLMDISERRDDEKKEMEQERQRDREMMMQFMFSRLLGGERRNPISDILGSANSRILTAEEEEERMLMQAIEESKRDAPFDHENPNPDHMTYEQMLELEERNGKVSKGFTKQQVAKLPSKTWRCKTDTTKKLTQCSVCFENFRAYDTIKELAACKHAYHSKCIDKWLESEKRCPVCNDTIIIR
mmetsp:Transcript_4807/g.8242  ORF Transcript_4807/g.8242 Transcript_4807/m.8242 type:complete len:281 (-) Transcript_4807:86-928(-)